MFMLIFFKIFLILSSTPDAKITMGGQMESVICIKWGDSKCYSAKYVNNLYASVKRNTTHKVDFYCFTDDDEGFNQNIITKPLPKVDVADLRHAYRKEISLCDKNLGDLAGKRVLYFDLDTVIVGNIDGFFELPKNDDFYIINDWNSWGNSVGQASCYSFVVGSLGYIKENFEENCEKVYDKFHRNSQKYLSNQVIKRYGKLNFWPDEWAKSFRFHCLPTPLIPFLRRFKMAEVPVGAKIICFHGKPKMEDAQRGMWYEKNGWKKVLYKHLAPVTWIKDFWNDG
jgi:hypothetical protein